MASNIPLSQAPLTHLISLSSSKINKERDIFGELSGISSQYGDSHNLEALKNMYNFAAGIPKTFLTGVEFNMMIGKTYLPLISV